MSDCKTPESLEPIYQWKHSNRSVIGKTWWQDCTEADFNVRNNKPQFDVRILFETTAIIESLRSENAAMAKRIAELEAKVQAHKDWHLMRDELAKMKSVQRNVYPSSIQNGE